MAYNLSKGYWYKAPFMHTLNKYERRQLNCFVDVHSKQLHQCTLHKSVQRG